MKELLNRITTIEDWYEKLRPDFNGLEDLLDKADELGVLQSRLCTRMGESHKEWLVKKSEYNRIMNQLWTTLKSKYKAEANSSRQYQTMNEKEGEYRYLKARKEGVEVVLERMNQRISQLKEEWKLSKYTRE